ncbi:hypothetical protein SAMN02799630_05364 [Paenibacillus sp. UNCCL117]|uniref:hypothetical protein n=1 Tax=unclassified Paenibacillus TaxID=185978 RepID=UPI000881BCB8|nr:MULTISPECIES: hypothetical protein [unclassified Paenibacillus]SDE40663.1 hypothetical protein SAMN04488602_12733 [Paenibacillus sp. cl123]SFW65375.1 hypothetical protein SAMN02799630_05364 [Paenibacillus sp. UNCCL117]
MTKRASFRSERGGVHVLLAALLAIIPAVLLWGVAWSWLLHAHTISKSKPLLDQAARAASMNVNKAEAALGRIVWDGQAGRDDFFRYLRLNFRLAPDMTPLAGSPLTAAPFVHRLEFVEHPSYPYLLTRSITVHEGGDKHTVRRVQVTIYGPSVLAIVELASPQLGGGREEPIVLSSVASVRFR